MLKCIYCGDQLEEHGIFSCENCKRDRYRNYAQSYTKEKARVVVVHPPPRPPTPPRPPRPPRAPTPPRPPFEQKVPVAEQYKKKQPSSAYLDMVGTLMDIMNQTEQIMVSPRPSSSSDDTSIAIYSDALIQKNLEIKLRNELTTELTKSITAQVESDYKKKRSVLAPEDISVARSYFRDVELTALATNAVLVGKINQIKAKAEKIVWPWWKQMLMNMITTASAGCLAIVLGFGAFGALIATIIASIIIASIHAYRVHCEEKIISSAAIFNMERDARTASLLADSARHARTVDLLNVKDSIDLFNLVSDIKDEQKRLSGGLHLIDPTELDAARTICESRIADPESDDFMSRLRDKQNDMEFQAESEALDIQSRLKSKR